MAARRTEWKLRSWLLARMAGMLMLVVLGAGCGRDVAAAASDDRALDPLCSLEVDPGPMMACFDAFYYFPPKRKCLRACWGGTGGVVPFKTLADCQATCE